jgi:hypothetical protein
MADLDPQVLAAVTLAVRAADVAFESSGGSSRHWVREQFLPRLDEEGLVLIQKDSLLKLRDHVVHHVGTDNWPGHMTAWHCDLCEGDERDGGHKPGCPLFGIDFGADP